MSVTLFKTKNWDVSEGIILKAREAVENDKLERAATLYDQILVITADFEKSGWQRIMRGEACAFFAIKELNAGNYGKSFDWFRNALKADPLNNHIRVEYITKILVPMDQLRNARNEAEKATRIDPDDPHVWKALGFVETNIGDAKRALAARRKQVSLAERSSLALLDLLGLLIDTENYQEAESVLKEVEQRNEQMRKGDVAHYWGILLARYGRHEEAIEYFKQALDIFPSAPVERSLVHFNMSLSLHSIGRYKEGFESLSKRINNSSQLALYVPMQRFNKPLFEMQEPPAVVHIHAEAGDGDNFCLIRYLPLLAAKGYTVRYEARNNFYDLVKYSFEDIETVPLALDHPGTLGIKDFDYHLPIGELPYQFGTDIDTIPWNGPYIKSDPELVKKYECYRGKIGIAWSSGIRKDEGIWLKRYGELKSLSFELIKPIVMEAPERFVSLQVGPPADENGGYIDNGLSEGATWSDTAAIIDNLDLVVTPDTGLAHLVGAMGKPCWIMMHGYNSGWHFMCERLGAMWNEKSVWYPSIRLFRQKVAGDWSSVIKEIEGEIYK